MKFCSEITSEKKMKNFIHQKLVENNVKRLRISSTRMSMKCTMRISACIKFTFFSFFLNWIPVVQDLVD